MKTRSPSKSKIHFIGIGGIGTSALARWFLSHGYKISGSDISVSEITRKLKQEGANVFIGHKFSNLPPGAGLVIRSAAATMPNPEIKKALKLKIPVKTYAEALGDVGKNYDIIAVAGAHGKSTSTSLLSLSLIKAKFDPTVIIGTNLKEFGNKNFRRGNSRYLIIEADEYQQSFLNYSPTAALITNIDREHLDFYENLDAIKKVFLKFISNIKPGGTLVINKDDNNISGLKKEIRAAAIKSKIKIHWYGLKIPALASARNKIGAIIKLTGGHNLSNALGVYVLAKSLGAKEKDILAAIGAYRGAWRRMEYRGRLKLHDSRFMIQVYDDYAHHPSEIKATLSGLREKYPDAELICVFEPHQAKRLQYLFKEFVAAFDDADKLILLHTYRVAGRDASTRFSTSKMSQNVDSKKLSIAIDRHLKHFKNGKKQPFGAPFKLKQVIYLPPSPGLPKRLKSTLIDSINQSQAIVVMMGAGDIYKLTDKLIKS